MLHRVPKTKTTTTTIIIITIIIITIIVIIITIIGITIITITIITITIITITITTIMSVMFVDRAMEVHLLQGCHLEAERSEVLSQQLSSLGNALPPEPNSSKCHLTAATEALVTASHLLRTMADLSQIQQQRTPLILDALNTVLPCLSRCLRDVSALVRDRSRARAERWRRVCCLLGGGDAVAGRFGVYNGFLASVRDLLVRLTVKAPPSAQVGPLISHDTMPPHHVDPVPAIQIPRSPSHLEPPPNPPNSKPLHHQSFNASHLSLTIFLDGASRAPYLLLRILVLGAAWFSVRGVHELCIDRESSSGLRFKRWSASEAGPKLWAVLYFATWEELVLLHSVFVSLKARNGLTVRLAPEEFRLRGESRLFQACIIDDGSRHVLIVYRDRQTGALRLHASVCEGELRNCPVWTAFVTHQSASPTWLTRISPHRVRLADIQLYVFCRHYRQQNQRRGSIGAFDIRFVADQAAARFEQVFYSPPNTPEPV
ncbi:hypothetical protein GQ602_000202 [Ophiocordyceps camponoti-floridani]|uniref:Uncharacterized protein n=1 Tax=Ophiocordyceps camponoti-floridani TaxID=2030778 RepID=A0A8H4QBR7_9HYPO|nr:hypothetical protein GQ602_000202 [Ophiocordyceps camponoti-floridani]